MPRSKQRGCEAVLSNTDLRIPVEGEGVKGLELGTDPDWETALLSDPLAQKIVEKWVREGMYRDRLIELLNSYCKPINKPALRLWREEAKRRRKSAVKLVRAVRRLQLALAGASKQDGDAELIRDADDPRINLRGALERYLSRLEWWEMAFARAASAKGTRKELSARRRGNRNDYYLVRLAIDLREVTGKRYYGDLAYLVERGLHAYDSEKEDLDGEVIKKRVQRFMKDNPTLDHPRDLLLL